MTYNHQARPSNKAEKLPYINLTHIKKSNQTWLLSIQKT